MTILDRYVLKIFFGLFLGSIVAVSFLFTVISVLDGLTYLSSTGMTTGQIVKYFLLQLPQTIFMSAPVAALLSAMIGLAGMNQHHELIAMRAAGRSLARITLPIVGAGFVIAAGLFVLGNTLVPRGNRAFLSARQEYAPDDREDPNQRIWYVSEGRDGPAILRIGRVDRGSGRVENISIFSTGPDFQLEEQINAASADYGPGGWTLSHAERRVFNGFEPPTLFAAESMTVSLPDTPDDLLAAQRAPEELSWSELNFQIKRAGAHGLSVAAYRVERHARMAIPLAAVVLILSGIPLAIRPVRAGGLAYGIVAAIVLGFAYFVIIAELIAMGKGGLVPPATAAWTANVFFGVIGAAAFSTLRR